MKQEDLLKEIEGLRRRVRELEDIQLRLETSERALRESEERFRTVFEQGPLGMSILRLNFERVAFNAKLTEMYGYTKEELRKLTFLDLTHPDDLELTWEHLDKLLKKEIPFFQIEKRYIKKGGEIIWGRVTLSAVRDSQGELLYLLSMIEEITERKRAQERLRESEERFRAIFENAAIGIDVVDSSGSFLQVNRSLAEMLGYTEHELLNLTIFDISHPDDVDVSRIKHEKMVHGEIESYRFEKRYIRKDGDVLWADVSVSPVRGPDGVYVATVGVIADITDRKQADEDLKRMNERFSLAANAAGLGVWDWDIQKNELVWDDRMYALYGIQKEDFAGAYEAWLKGVHPDDRAGSDKISKLARLGEREYDTEFRVVWPDGSIHHLKAHGQIVRDADGRPLRMTGINFDITERKKAEEGLRESEERFRLAFDNAYIGVCLLDTQGRLIRVNNQMCEIFGYSRSELETMTVNDIAHPEDLDVSPRFIEGARSGEVGRAEFEKRYIHKQGHVVWGRISSALVRDKEGNPSYFISHVQDITDRKRAQEALERSEANYRAMFDSMNDAVFVHDAETGAILDVNRKMCEMYGYTRDEAVRLNVETISVGQPPYTQREALQWLRKAVREGPQRFEWIGKDKKGRCFWIEVNLKSALIGGERRILAVVRDIADRKLAEEALAASEEWYRSLVDRSFDGIFVQQGPQIVYANARLYEMLGYSEGELEGIDHWLIYHPDYQEITRERAKARMRGEEVVSQYEVKLKRKDGSSLDGEINAIGVTVKGEPGVQVWVRDVSKRKRLEEVQRRLATAIEQAGEAIIITDRRGNVEYVNPAHERMTGYTREEVIGSLPPLFKEHELDPELRRKLSNSMLRGAAWSGRMAGRRKDGTLCEMDVTVSPVRDPNGRIVNLVGVERDITEEVQLQRQLLQAQKMEAIGTLAGGVAHDFNNLLQGILGYTDILLMKKGPDDPDRKKLEVIQHAVRDGADLVGRILTFSRKGESKIRPIDLNDEIRRVEKLLSRTLPRMIQIDLLLAEDLRIVDADPAQIEQVLLNLGVNAQHAMPDGGQLLIETSNVSLRDEYLRTHLGARPGHYVLLTVSDTGVGIEPDVLDRIFEPFFTTKPNGEGTGLGLSMVHGIVSQHGGHMRCYSEPGRGTSFKIYLPVSASESLSDLAMTREMPAFGTETILLVDDDDRIREMGRQVIEMGGYKVLTCRSGEEALEMYGSHGEEISLIILDLIMPGMGGQRCLEELLRIDPDARVLVASGYSSNGLSADEKGTGARGFVGKPYDAKDILGAIRKVLDEGHV